MSFRNGYLGALVLLIALVATICGSWVLSLDVTETETTQYNYLTELTGLFDTEQAPTYIEYNPSTNYIGYYTDPETEYFDGVSFTPAEQRNQYRLRLAPNEIYPPQSTDLSDTSSSTAYELGLTYWTANDSLQQRDDQNHATVAAVIAAMGWEALDEIVIVSDFDSWTAGGFITFYTPEMLDRTFTPVQEGHRSLALKNPNLTGNLTVNSLIGNTVPAADVLNPVLACKYDSETGFVELFYDTAMQNSLGIYTPESVWIAWSNSSASNFQLGNSFTMTGADYPSPVYMDIRQGVKVLEE